MTEQESDIERAEQRTSITLSETYEGPIPNPAMLRGFEEVVEGSAEKILDDSLTTLEHVRWADEQRIGLVVWTQKWSQILRAVYTLLLVCLGVFLLLSDHTVAGYVLIAAGAGPNTVLAAVPLIRRRNGGQNGSSQ